MHFKNLVEGTHTPQDFAFTSVHQQSFDEINRIHEKYKVDYHTWQLYTTREKRFWLWPFGWCGAWIYHMWIYMYVWTKVVRSILAIGLVRFGGPSHKSKEVNVGYTLHFCALKDNWQNFVIEVGEFKSYVMLHANVTYWFSSNDGKNFLMILLSINWINK